MLPVTIKWKGEGYKIPPNEIISLIAQVENVLTLYELQNFALKGTLPQAKIAKAYTIVLNWVGVSVSELDVYYEMFPQEDEEDEVTDVATAIKGLMVLMTPPERLRNKLANSGNSKAPVKSGASLKKRTRRG